MKNYDYHNLFYYGIVAMLQGLRGPEGDKLTSGVKIKNAPSFNIAYPPRTLGLQHQYERENDINDRDRLVVALPAGKSSRETVVLMRVKRYEDKAIIYKKALRHLFKGNSVVARRELMILLDKFYEITTDSAYNGGTIDYSDALREPRQAYILDLSRSPMENTTRQTTADMWSYGRTTMPF